MKRLLLLTIFFLSFSFFLMDVNGIENGIYCDKKKHLYLVVCDDEFVYIDYFKCQDLSPLHSIARGKINADSCYLECYQHKECNLDNLSPLYALSPFCEAALRNKKINYKDRKGKIKKVEIVYPLSTNREFVWLRKIDQVQNPKVKFWINEVMDTVYYHSKMNCVVP